MSKPLQGYRVLEWGNWIAAPVAAMMLGDLGADVIKIEHRVTGDPSRGLDAGYGSQLGRQSLYESFNRSKKGITLDLRQPEAREVVYQLVEKSDVFVTNFRQSVIERNNMGYETLSARNSMLVYGLVTGYGSKGAEADVRSYDGLAQGRSALSNQCDPDMPIWIRPAIGDTVAGSLCAFGLVTALLDRERTGEGRRIETSLLETLLFEQCGNLGMHFIGSIPVQPISRKKPPNPLMNMYRCGDDKWINLYHPEADRFWPGFCQAMGIQNLQDDPKYVNIWVRNQNSEELVSLLDPIFVTKSRDEWINILRANECVVDVINDYDDLLTDPQVVANNYLPEFDHPNYGTIRCTAPPIEFDGLPMELQRPAPEFGQHTEEVLLDVLGYDWDQISKLKDQEVI